MKMLEMIEGMLDRFSVTNENTASHNPQWHFFNPPVLSDGPEGPEGPEGSESPE